MFFQHLISALQWGSFYALIALGYTLVYGVLTLFNFAHGDIFMAGAYAGFFVSAFLIGAYRVGLPIALPRLLVFILTLFLSMIMTAFLGMAVERIAYRPLRDAPRVSAALTGLMLGLLMETSNLWALGAMRRQYPPLFKSTIYEVGGVTFTDTKVTIIAVSILVMLGLEFIVRRTMVGMAMRAISFDSFAVPLMGVPGIASSPSPSPSALHWRPLQGSSSVWPILSWSPIWVLSSAGKPLLPLWWGGSALSQGLSWEVSCLGLSRSLWLLFSPPPFVT